MPEDQSLITQTDLESIKHTDNSKDDGFWFARELMPLLGYTQWKNFHRVIKKAIVSLQKTYPQPADHFAEVGKKIKIGKGSNKESTRTIMDYKLTRYACYLIAQNGDPKKQPIALAQSYFATQTRKQEIAQAHGKDLERVMARRKLRETEKKFSSTLADHGVQSRGVAEIRSAGDKALFNEKTSDMKKTFGVNKGKPLADHLPTITLKAKDLATEITTFNTQDKTLLGKDLIRTEHVNNNYAVRKLLNEKGIYPELLPPEQDVREIEKQLSPEELDLADLTRLGTSKELIIDIRSITNKEELQKVKDIITQNSGKVDLKIIYGSKAEKKIITRGVKLNKGVVLGLKKYLVI